MGHYGCKPQVFNVIVLRQRLFIHRLLLIELRVQASLDEAMPHQPLHGCPTNSVRLHRPCLMLLLILLLCPLENVLAQGEDNTHAKAQSPTVVLQDLLTRYGDNFTITVPQLRALLSHLSRDQGDDANNTSVAATERPPVATPKAISSKVRTIWDFP